jgi:branched-chain amino acid transport system permease protein
MLRHIQRFGAPAIVCFLFLAPIVVTGNLYLHVMIMMCINVVMATSMWLLATTGLLSFGQAGFMFIGAMTSTLLVKNLGWPFWVCIPLAGIIPALVALAVGRVCIHIKGAQFFMVTMAFGELVRGIFAYFRNPFGGWNGIVNIPAPEPHHYFTSLNKVGYYYLGVTLTVITCWTVYRVSRSRIGMIFWSVRESETLADSIGVNIRKHKLQAFLFAAFFAGVAGTYYAHYTSYISPLVFTVQMSLNVLIFVVVGGMWSFAGPIVGAAVLTLVPEFFRATGVYQMLIYGVILVFAVLFMPRGIVGVLEEKVFPRLIKARRAAGGAYDQP